MPITREQLHQLVEVLPEQEIVTAQRFLMYLSQESVSGQLRGQFIVDWSKPIPAKPSFAGTTATWWKRS